MIKNSFPGLPISVVDNILDMNYFKSFIPMLAERPEHFVMFYEVKANIKKEQVKQLRDAGITTMQPGIESLSDDILTLMAKGVRAIQNIQLLKWCKEYGIRAEWNFLWGFPKENPSEYARMTEMLPLLSHLSPPRGASCIRMDRFSPNYDRSSDFGFSNVRPFTAYSYLYPFDVEILSRLAYFFQFDYTEPRNIESYVGPLLDALAVWKEFHNSSELFSVDLDEHLLVWDSRPVACQPLYVLNSMQKQCYLACDQLMSLEQVTASAAGGREEAPKEVKDIMNYFVAKKLMIRSGNSYLSLAVPWGDYRPSARLWKNVLQAARAFGKVLPNGDILISSK